jgi:hypothetical protein
MTCFFWWLIGIIGGVGWGMYVQEVLQKRGRIKASEARIVIDAPFSPAQSERIMNVLVELNEAIRESTKPLTALGGND